MHQGYTSLLSCLGDMATYVHSILSIRSKGANRRQCRSCCACAPRHRGLVCSSSLWVARWRAASGMWRVG